MPRRDRTSARSLRLTTVVVAREEILSGETNTEAVMLNLNDGRYYGVEEVAARIWQLIQEPVALGTLRDAIVAEYHVQPARCQADLRRFIAALVDRGLARIVPPDAVA